MSIYLLTAAGTGKSTCVHPVKEPVIDDGSTGGVLQQKEDEGMLLIFVCGRLSGFAWAMCVSREKNAVIFFEFIYDSILEMLVFFFNEILFIEPEFVCVVQYRK